MKKEICEEDSFQFGEKPLRADPDWVTNKNYTHCTFLCTYTYILYVFNGFLEIKSWNGCYVSCLLFDSAVLAAFIFMADTHLRHK